MMTVPMKVLVHVGWLSVYCGVKPAIFFQVLLKCPEMVVNHLVLVLLL